MSNGFRGQPIEIADITPVVAPKFPATQGNGAIPANEKIYIRSASGKFESIRRGIGVFLISVFLALPWLTYSGQQAILLDIANQRFHLFALTLWPQDLTLLAWLFIISAFALFLVTVIWGRVWCGFACPQTVFTFVFVWVEEKVEGTRHQRMHLDKQPMSANKLTKKSLKHGIWLFIATVTAITFIGYFTPIKPLVREFAALELSFWTAFYLGLFTFCTYGNAGWMREIMCTHICPYSRFQSAMFDNDTVTVTYDKTRGEGRGPRPKKMPQQQYQQQDLGDCIDCNLCVQVCPAGIDIRNGLQYECINCGACVDACNGVMSKMGYKKDLISFTSVNALKGKIRAKLNPKAIGYFAVLTLMLAAFTAELATRKPIDINVIRDRSSLYRETLSGSIENVYTLVIMNKTQHPQQVKIATEGLASPIIHGQANLIVAGEKLVQHPITIEVDRASLEQPVTRFSIVLSNEHGDSVRSDATFFKGYQDTAR